VPPVGEIELINIRVALTARVGARALAVGAAAAAAAHPKGRRQAWIGATARYADLPVFDRLALGIGATVDGPAIVEEASSTLIVPPGARATVDPAGNLIVDLPAR
jgi:N-methylhydantoinase A